MYYSHIIAYYDMMQWQRRPDTRMWRELYEDALCGALWGIRVP